MKDRKTYGWDDERHRHPILLDVPAERFRIKLWHEHDGGSDHESERKEHHGSWYFIFSLLSKNNNVETYRRCDRGVGSRVIHPFPFLEEGIGDGA